MTEAATPQPQLDVWEWQFQGLCRTQSPELFFHPDGERGAARRTRESFAMALCQECPVLQQCREHALAFPEPYGVWGGMTEAEREEIVSGSVPRAS